MESFVFNRQQIVLDAQAFRAWLAAHAPADSVGHTGGMGTCPIGNWLFELYRDRFDICPDGTIEYPYALSAGSERVGFSQWAGTFSLCIDQINGFVQGEPVRAAQALEVFDCYCQ